MNMKSDHLNLVLKPFVNCTTAGSAQVDTLVGFAAMPKHTSKINTTPTYLTVNEDSGATAIGIVAPTDTGYAAQKLTITVTSLPSDGSVLLSDGVTLVTIGMKLTVAQLTGLLFKPSVGSFGESWAFTYKGTDASGASAVGGAALAVGPDTLPPVTTAASLTVAGNSGATPIGIAAPTDPNYSASQLSANVTRFPGAGARPPSSPTPKPVSTPP